ncbi:hypothetical protein BS638_12420 [Clostridium tepidum]|uniref:DEAD/DEAH-box helicase domain-containing protein n=1 Tax=Clostridium tepidum TaxID=1962263 RepID=A0A1S9I124_9CLOT|nr:DEAD/DEAH box helicase [Clostridium tepidum]OOO63997.1 hypothetical protein BS638_12420 [Clostridium tepidum]
MKFISEENYNNLRKDKQLNYLDKYIKSGQSKDKFKLFTHEVGKGKSVLTSFSVVEGYLNNDIKYLYVVKNNKLAKEAEDRINTYCKTKGLADLAIFINSENKRKEFKNISKYPILIITHARYKICCIDKKQKKEIIKDRQTLIIDEEIQIFEPLQYNINRYNWYFNLLSNINPTLAIQYNKAVGGILNALYTYKGKMVYNCTKKDYKTYKKEIIKLKNMLNKFNAKDIKLMDIKDIDGLSLTKKNIINECDIVDNFYTHTAYFECNNLYTYDNRYDFWLLDNNILLDASGLFLYIYKLSDIFDTKGLQNRNIDRSGWKINFCNINTTTSAKDKMINFYDEVKNHIKAITKNNDKLLIAGKKDVDDINLKDIIDNETIDYGYYGNLVGHNTWKDFNKFYSIATFQTPSFVYVIKYLFYSKKTITNKTNLKGINDGKGANKVYRFFNIDLEKVRTSTIVSEIYQAMGRIARVEGINAEFYLLMNDDSLKDLIIKQFKNIQVQAFDLDVKFEKKDNLKQQNYLKEHNKNMAIEGKQGDFMRLMLDIKKGNYNDIVTVDTENKAITIKKKLVAEKLEVNPKKFAEKILNKPLVMNFINNNNIEIQGQKIIINY